ncbi:MAG: alpha/beta hydrolase, partial [Pseudomonadota bacterium]
MYTDLDFENVEFIPDGATYPVRWQDEGQAFRERAASIGRARLNVPYGPAERQKLDLFHPTGKPKGLVVFVHGGYWRRFDRSLWGPFSTGLTDRGWAVAIPSYTLAPEARVGAMTIEIARALEAAGSLIAGPIHVTGHSAGGHLTARMGCKDVAIAPKLSARIKRLVPISPLSDLRALLNISMNETLQLDPAEAAAESPVLHDAPNIPTTVWVGAEERPVFLEQAIALSETWRSELRISPGCHHFDAIDGLTDPN